MKTSDFYFDLPKELIAQDPLEDRSSSRLLVLDRKIRRAGASDLSGHCRISQPGRLPGHQQHQGYSRPPVRGQRG